MKGTRWLLLSAALCLAGCGATIVHPEIRVPRALIKPLPLNVGVYYGTEYREFMHRETRWGSDWQITLGPQHVRLTDDLFAQAFEKVVVLKKFPLDGAVAPVQAIIEPKIEQYSFLTPRDTGGDTYAVTIKYRLMLDAPTGEIIDSYQFTGYGTADGSGMSSTKPLLAATMTAMRDAAAKFLVQFPQQPSVRKLVTGETLVAASNGQGTSEAEELPIAD